MTAGGRVPDRGAVGDLAGAEAARALLGDLLRDTHRAGAAVEAAFRAVPRHVFLPEMAPEQSYQDEAFVIKHGADGLPLSSSSQPAIMAIMLEQLGLAPGQRVLEIGAGTGYNAALIAHIVGDQESVITIDIDEEIVSRARASLAAAGYGGVRVSCGDGGLGVPEHAPYDRIIVTAGAWDLAPGWLAQLAPGGRIVLPLSVRGIHLSVALERAADHWASTSACRCGFIRMAGAFAGPESFVPVVGQPGLYVLADGGQAADPGALPAMLPAALDAAATDVPTELRADGMRELADLDLWLTLTESWLTRLTVVGTRGRRAGVAELVPFGGLAGPVGMAGELGVATVVPGRPGSRGAAESSPVVLRGFGPGGAYLAGYLARQAVAWDKLGRPGASTVRLRAYLRGPGADDQAGPRAEAQAGPRAGAQVEGAASTAAVILDRQHARLVLDWPTF